MTEDRFTDLEAAAHHEGGHFIAAVGENLDIGTAYIRRTGNGSVRGACEYARPSRPLRQLVVVFAGPAAQARYEGTDSLSSAIEKDLADVTSIVRSLPVSEARRERILMAACKAAHDLVRDEFERVKAVAEVLAGDPRRPFRSERKNRAKRLMEAAEPH